MRSSLETINIAASTQKLEVDNRISLRFYYRIADNILKQADIFRAENNIVDLYIMLLRFSSLVSETIPCHRDYRTSPQSKKVSLRKRLLNSMNELEKLKPLVQQKIIEFNSRKAYQHNGWGKNNSNSLMHFSPMKKETLPSYGLIKEVRPTAGEFVSQGLRGRPFSYAKPIDDKMRRLSLTLPRPTDETLSRHSVLGPNGLNGKWLPPISDKGVRYPSNIDLSPVEIPSLQQALEDGSQRKKDDSAAELNNLDINSSLTQTEDCQAKHADEPPSLISFEEATETTAPIEVIRQPSPPPVLAEVQDLVPAVSPKVDDVGCKIETPSSDDFLRAESPLQLHISTAMMETFMKFAQSNTKKNLETCGILAGLLKNRKFYITALIIPKQEATSSSCQATNEEEIFEAQDKRSLFPLGWIHTHPTQSCFMSSIDVHTHYSYQIMLPEAVAIVMAPTDSSRKHGIFRLTSPGGMSVIRNCPQRGFHPHDPPPDGGPIYDTCTDVYMNPDLKFDVIDLR
ncbi:AMSH-like ubiquitin thioesterase 1 [Stylosanthes scabra]|uniref:AMSH-like ubiquitin thioesterase 1 n=1 Tax=Stylosanthes scabra TaxID=79078 RepID=A0ABU6WLN8_9FABA|nr:AMSH-like ubiquitin thioesterase 1 [Stylosanthes scabra]